MFLFSSILFLFWAWRPGLWERLPYSTVCMFYIPLFCFCCYFLSSWELKLVVVYVCYYTYLRSLGVLGGLACNTYMYIWFDFSLVGLYANMAEMPGVRQIDRSCPFFYRIWKTILNIKRVLINKTKKEWYLLFILFYRIWSFL